MIEHDYDAEFSEWFMNQMRLQPRCFDRDILRALKPELKETFIRLAKEMDNESKTS